ncbi:MAG: right-handed parallel beta-helix repeat-containing protein [Pseudomonadota bacterium]
MRRLALLALLVTTGACDLDVVTTAVPEPILEQVTPASGRQDVAQSVEILGRELRPLIENDPSQPGGLRVDTTFRAWLGNTALRDVRYVDDEHLTAQVPVGLTAGFLDLRVETPRGLKTSLADAYEVLVGVGPAITSVIPSDIVNDQDEVLDVVGSGFDSGLQADLEPPAGARIALPVTNLSTSGFTATVAQGTAAGAYDLVVTTEGGATATLPGAVQVWNPAQLVSTLELSAASVSTGTEITLTVHVANTGGSEAQAVQVSLPVLAGSGTAQHLSGPSPASADIAAGAAQDFVLQYRAQSAGSVTFTAQASGTNAYSLRPLASGAATSASLQILVGAALEIALDVPAGVGLGQSFDIEMTVTNSGQGDAQGVTPVLALSGSGALTLDSGPTPATADVAGGQAQLFVYSYTASGLGEVHFTADASGTDVVNSTTIQAPTETAGPMSVMPQSVLVAAWQTASATLLHGASIDLVLRVSNTGGTRALAVTPTSLSLTGTTGTSCAAATPASVDLDGGSLQDFSFACTVGNSAGAWTAVAGAQGTDATTSAAVSAIPVATAPFQAVGPAALGLGWLALPAQVSTGQAFAAVLRATNSGGSGTLGVAPTGFVISGSTGSVCTGPTPATANLGAASQQDFSYSCTAGSSSGSLQLSAGISGTAVVDGATLTVNAATSDSVGVLQAATLDLLSVTSPASDVYQGQSGQVISVLVENTGEVSATVSTSGLQFTTSSVDVSSEYPVVPRSGNPTSVAAAAQATLVFDVSVSPGAATGVVTVDASISGADDLSAAAIGGTGATTPLSWNVLGNTAPVACLTAPGVVTTGVSFQLDAGCSSDAEDAVGALTVAWDLDDDGVYELAPSTTKTLDHTLATTGAHRIGLEIQDTRGASSHLQRVIFAEDAARIIVVTTTAAAGAGSLAEALATANGNANVDTIRFDPTVFDGGQPTIAMGNTTLTISQPARLVGHAGVRIQGNRDVFNITAAGVAIANLEIEGKLGGGTNVCVNATGANLWLLGSRVFNCDTGVRIQASGVEVGPGNVFDKAEYAIQVSSGTNHRIHGNTVLDCSTTACLRFADGTGPAEVVSNLFAGATVPLIATSSATGLRILHNTLHGSSNYGLSLGGSGHEVKNNIFSANTYGAICDTSGLTASSNDYNAFFNNGLASACPDTRGAHVVLADPKYVNAGTGDFRLQSSSPCIDAGIDLGFDLNGGASGLFGGIAPDLGAVESL